MSDTIESLRQEFGRLVDEVNIFHFYYKTLEMLYLDGTDEDFEAYDRVAPFFFDSHHRLLLYRIYMGFRVFTDRPEMGTSVNLSFRYFLNKLGGFRDVADLAAELDSYEDRIRRIKKTLHKKLGHLDRDMALGKVSADWLDVDELRELAEQTFRMTNSFALAGWNYSMSFLDPNQNFDLHRFREHQRFKKG